MPGQIYIAPPGYQCTVESGTLQLHKQGAVNYSEPSIDVTLESLSKQYKERLAIILLCGYGSDGTLRLADANVKGSTLISIRSRGRLNLLEAMLAT